jgi:release factor glutamine methyltransferase
MASTSPLTLAQTQADLQTQGLDRLDAQLLLLHVLDQPTHHRGWLLTHDTDLLAQAPAARLAALVQRRLAGEPLAYLTGKKAFYGLDLQVDARVLVPRPDTETLVDWALEVLSPTATLPAGGTPANPPNGIRRDVTPTGQQAQVEPQNGVHVLDLGTGSGAIALALKASLPGLHIHAIDFSSDALAVAQSNARQLKLAISFSQGSWFEGLSNAECTFDCIVSNPPYIAALDPHLAALTHEPLQALTSGPDGLDDLRHIITHAPRFLKPGGHLLLEHGFDQAPAVRELLTLAGFTQVGSRRDLAGIERCSGGQFIPKGTS